MKLSIWIIAAALPLAPAFSQAPQPLQQRVETLLRAAGQGARYGLVLTD